MARKVSQKPAARKIRKDDLCFYRNVTHQIFPRWWNRHSREVIPIPPLGTSAHFQIDSVPDTELGYKIVCSLPIGREHYAHKQRTVRLLLILVHLLQDAGCSLKISLHAPIRYINGSRNALSFVTTIWTSTGGSPFVLHAHCDACIVMNIPGDIIRWIRNPRNLEWSRCIQHEEMMRSYRRQPTFVSCTGFQALGCTMIPPTYVVGRAS